MQISPAPLTELATATRERDEARAIANDRDAMVDHRDRALTAMYRVSMSHPSATGAGGGKGCGRLLTDRDVLERESQPAETPTSGVDAGRC